MEAKGFPRDSIWMVCYYLRRGDDDDRRPADKSKKRISLADTGYVHMEANTILLHTEYHPKGVSGCMPAPASSVAKVALNVYAIAAD